MYKAVFIDIDGTLLRSDHTISEATLKTVRLVDQRGILVVFVSARPLSGILPIIEKFGKFEHPVASLNGAYIIDKGQIIFDSMIEADTAENVHEYFRKYEATPIYYQQDKWFSEFRNAAVDHEQKITSIPVIILPFKNLVADWRNRNSGPNKILTIADSISVMELQAELKLRFGRQLNISTSKPTFLEIMRANASKVNAVKLIIDRYKIRREEIIAIGDNFNDLEMIAYAGIGIAMGNAPDLVKAEAHYITDTNNNDGVAKALERFILL
jgi:Cof subfamily protein (haloacid dehalogenase superfamily)